MADPGLAEADRAFQARYGRAKPKKKGPLGRLGERKFFDSADNAMNIAGVKTEGDVGKVIASTATVPHKGKGLRPTSLHMETSEAEAVEGDAKMNTDPDKAGAPAE
eukprot:m.16069 g.16069  ORF g.16069 m.16069 type:complete len:106 (-) comp5153_c1_seq1:228-545(-)